MVTAWYGLPLQIAGPCITGGVAGLTILDLREENP
jgi:hypothetical protein